MADVRRRGDRDAVAGRGVAETGALRPAAGLEIDPALRRRRFALTQGLYALTALLFGESGGIHIEVLLPAFVLGMTMRHRHVDSAAEARASSFVSFLFMFLVGVSMPLFIGVQHAEALSGHHSVTGSQPMMSWGTIAVHVLIVSLLSNLGKLFPVFSTATAN